jgi:hypothetical protein
LAVPAEFLLLLPEEQSRLALFDDDARYAALVDASRADHADVHVTLGGSDHSVVGEKLETAGSSIRKQTANLLKSLALPRSLSE